MKTLGEGRRVLHGLKIVAAVALGLLGVIGLNGGIQAVAQPSESVALNQKKISDIVGDAKNRGLDVKVVQENDANVFLIKSVDQWLLKQLVYQHIRVTGIVSTFDQTKQRYRFQTPDNSTVFVVGKYPGHGVTRTLNATVGDGSPHVLYEVEPPAPPSAANNKIIYTAAGVALIALALGALGLVAYSNKQKAAPAKAAPAKAADEERLRREAEEKQRIEAEQRRSEEEARSRDAVPASGSNSAATAPDRTIHSVGSLKVESGPLAGMSFPLEVGETRIGRQKSSGCQIVLEQDGEVSAYHGSLIVTQDRRAIYKDASSNGTLVNGQFVQYGQVDVPAGAKIEIGGSAFTLVMRRAGSVPSAPGPVFPVSGEPSSGLRETPTVQIKAPAAPSAPTSGAAPTAVSFGAELEVLEGSEKGQRFPVSKPVLTFGREARDILLSDSSISRSHATLTLKEGQFFLTDDGSTHGTSVNGEKIDGAGRRLMNGDEIAFGSGSTRLKFRSING